MNSMEVIYANLFRGPKRRVLAVARNYFGAQTPPTLPVLFQKPMTAIINIELGILVGHPGKNIPIKDSMKYVGGYCLALDMSAANLLTEVRKAGLPWDIGKGYDGALPLSPLIDVEMMPDPHAVRLQLLVTVIQVNGEMKQDASTSDMHFKVPYIIHYLSTQFALHKGDLIITGTPPGAGLLKPKDKLEARCMRGESLIFFCKFSAA